MKLNNLSLRQHLNIFVLAILLLAMSLMLVSSLYFYKKHLAQEVYDQYESIAISIISEKLYMLKDMNAIKMNLAREDKWCFSPSNRVLFSSEILITTDKVNIPDASIIVTKKAQENIFVHVYMSDDYAPAGYKTLMKTLIFILIFILCISSLLIIWRIRVLTEPLLCLTQFCKDIKEQSNILPFCQTKTSEVTALYQALVALISKNRSLCQNKVDLFKEIAHELKAPLSIMQARLELLQEDKDYDLKKYEEETALDISLMNSKLKELLFLKEIESDMQQDKTENICMMQECKTMQERFIRMLQLKNLTVNANWENSFTILTHTKVLQKVMQVIFENVFIHSKPDSIIDVKVYPDEKKMTITNEINPDTSEYISSHIGLKIIARLADKLHYEFETSQDNNNFITSIKFKS